MMDFTERGKFNDLEMFLYPSPGLYFSILFTGLLEVFLCLHDVIIARNTILSLHSGDLHTSTSLELQLNSYAVIYFTLYFPNQLTLLCRNLISL